MRIGTKSLLFGAHQFIVHPIMLLIAWWKLYGFPWDPRLWVAFVVHDLGYFGKKNMDGPEGEGHVLLGADIMHYLFDHPKYIWSSRTYPAPHGTYSFPVHVRNMRWYEFCMYHSRFWAKRHRQGVSRLCVADKYAIVISPWWWYVFVTALTGEMAEYRKVDKHVAELGDSTGESNRVWFLRLKLHMINWVIDNRWLAMNHDRKRGMEI